MTPTVKILLYLAVASLLFARATVKLEESLDEDACFRGTMIPSDLYAVLHFYNLVGALAWPITLSFVLAVRIAKKRR